MPERTRTVIRALTSGVTVALALGCEKGAPIRTPGPKTFNAATVESTSIDKIGAFVRGNLGFDSFAGADSFDLVEGHTGSKTAHLARIEPESSSFLLTTPEAAEGRIIARIYTNDTIPSLGLGPWWTWWWVDSIGTGHWRSVFIPEHGKPPYPVPTDSLEVERHSYQYKQALARFQVFSKKKPHGDPFFVETWSNGCGGCCKQRLPVALPQ